MSNNADDVISLDVHFITTDWRFVHKHIALIACNGKTNGAVIARKIKAALQRFDLLGKLFATTFDGGSNLRTAHEEFLRNQEGSYACFAVCLPIMYCSRCLAHLINGACNAAVLQIKARKFQVGSSLLS